MAMNCQASGHAAQMAVTGDGPVDPDLKTDRWLSATFAEIYEQYFPAIYQYLAGRLGRDIADDLAAETFVIAFRERHSFDPTRGGIRPWLFGIATNLVARHRRSEARRYRAMTRASTDRLYCDHEDQIATRLTAQQLRQPLIRALTALADGDRDVLLLVAVAGLTYPEVASALAIPEGTVGSRLNRARRKIAAALGSQDALTPGINADSERQRDANR
jgi:RNA polymerase sigma factor (sigma-70 family)